MGVTSLLLGLYGEGEVDVLSCNVESRKMSDRCAILRVVRTTRLTGEVLVNRGEGVELVLEKVLVLVVKETIASKIAYQPLRPYARLA